MSISRTDIIELENQLLKGIKKNNIGLLEEILHDDLLFLAPNGQIITKAIDLASHQKGEMIVEQIIQTIEEINIIDDTAIVVVVYETKGIMLGNSIQGQFRYIRIWKQFPEGLKVIGGSCCKL
jgi:hypothetical protein